MDVSKDNYSKIKKSIGTFLKANNDYKYEIKLTKQLNSFQYIRILKRLTYGKEYDGFGYPYEISAQLQINELDVISIYLNDTNRIKEYWLTGDVDIELFNAEKDIPVYTVDLPNYDLKFDLSKSDPQFLNKISEEGDKKYQYKNRYLIRMDNMLTLQMDRIRQGEGVCFRSSNTLGADETYAISFIIGADTEAEDTGADTEAEDTGTEAETEETKAASEGGGADTGAGSSSGVDGVIDRIFLKISEVLMILQGGYVLLSKRLLRLAKAEYLDMVGGEEDKFIRPMSSALLRNHLLSDSAFNVLENYAISLLPRGEPILLYFPESKQRGVAGHGFIIDEGLNFIPLDIQMMKWAGTLIEGYWIKKSGIIYVQDILFEHETDVRKRNFNTKIGTSSKCRISYLHLFMKDLPKDSSSSSSSSLIFQMSEYKSAKRDKLFDLIKAIWSNRESADFPVEGIQFRPITETYPMEGGMWHHLLTWLPVELNAIQFLVFLDYGYGRYKKMLPFISCKIKLVIINKNQLIGCNIIRQLFSMLYYFKHNLIF